MSGFKLNLQDTKFVLAQIKIAEAHAAGTPIPEVWVDAGGNVVPANTPGATLAVPTTISPYGLRTVDGSYNNITPGREYWGAADTVMPRALDADFRNDADGDTFSPGGPPMTNTNYNGTGNVIDADPRIISNLVVDQTLTNPAAVQAWLDNALSQAKWVEQHGANAVQLFPGDAMVPNGVYVTNADIAYIPNIAPDEGLSAPFNAWMTFFGQFFDHGLDLIAKGGNVGKVYIPLQADDPLMAGTDGVLGTSDDLPPYLQFMVLTRATVAPGGGHEAVNSTTAFVDQNQTYTSHASHQVFLREYAVEGGKPVSTGHLLDGANGGLPTWADVKAQALMLGIQLTDGDALNIPLLRTDQYGKFIPHPTTGMAQVVVGLGVDGIPNTADDVVVSGTPGSPVNTFTAGAVRIGHAFLDDINDEAAPVFVAGVLQQDSDSITGNVQARNAQGQKLTYDNELLDRHFITGDGRGNENIGLTTVHHVFHQEHNRQVEQQKLTVLASMDLDFINEWLDTDLTSLAGHPGANATLLQLQAFGETLNWDGERMFQAGRFATEMQYQHLVFEEFARKIQPNIDPFVFNSAPDIDPSIFAEFAHVVYRFGHSMLTDNMPRIDENGNVFDAGIDLVEAFLNPVSYDHTNDGITGNDLTADEAAASIIRGMTIETGNAIDEFLVESLRSNLLGLPLDLAVLNIARGRDTGVPSLNDTRTQLYAATNSSFLKPYESWVEFAANLKNPTSVVNFIAAYGRHPSINEDGTLEQKRDAAMLLVFGGVGAPADRVDFLNGTGAWAGLQTGLNDIDLWIGGLAEKLMPFGGMLGSTFNAIFEAQLENLQDGDRFYYLTRTQGQNLLVSLEQNSFAKLLMANSNLSLPGADGIRGTEDDIVNRHIGVDSFAKYDFVLEVNQANQADYTAATPGELAEANAAVDAAEAAAAAATAASNAADAAVTAATAALAAAVLADTTDAAALQSAATAAAAAAAALNTNAELGALLAAVTTAGATDAVALQTAANAAQVVANATDADALQTAATAAAAADAAVAAAQTLADATDAAALQAQATQAAADDAAAAAAQTLANATDAAALQAAANAAQALADAADADALQAAATAAAAADAAAIVAQAAADATDAAGLQSQADAAAHADSEAAATAVFADMAAQAEANALVALTAAQTALDALTVVTGTAQEIADATLLRDDAQTVYDAAVVSAAGAAQVAADALALAGVADAADLQVQANAAVAADAALVSALALAATADAAAIAAQAAAATDADGLQLQANAAVLADSDASAAAAFAALAAQAEADALVTLNAAQAALDALTGTGTPQEIADATLVRDTAQTDYDAAVASAVAEAQFAADAQTLADATNAVDLQTQADAAVAADAALAPALALAATTSADAIAAQTVADATDAAALQLQADAAVLADGNATSTAALAGIAAQAEADALVALTAAQTALDALTALAGTAQEIADATVMRDTAQTDYDAAVASAAAEAQIAADALALAGATDAVDLQAQAVAAAAADAALAPALALAAATDADALQTAATQAAAADAAAAALQAQATQAAADDAAAAAAQTLANATDAAALQAQATQAAAADAAAPAAQALANATDAAALQAQATQAAADDAAAAAAQALADATDAAALQAQATQAVAADAAAATAQAAASAAAAADAGVITAVNAYVAAVAADQAADAAAVSAAAAAAAAVAQDAAVSAATTALADATSAFWSAADAEVGALAALATAEDDLALLIAEGSAPGRDPIGNDPVLEALGQGKVVRDNPNTPGADTNYLRFYGGEHIVAGGTNGNDIIITDFGDDGIWGDAGNDRIESGAGVDLVNGGAGNDIITDSGDTGDFLKGDEGDDVIANSNGLDIIMGGTGQDAIFMGVDSSETFAGQGNDFVLGGAAADLIMGNEGDDWLEAGAGFDTTAGDNSELNFDSKIIGHDVMFAGSDEHDHDGESGDDIMVESESVVRSEGMFGFDWVIHKGVQTAANVDMGIPIFTTEQADILRDRYDKVEGASGWKFNDVLIGDDRIYNANANAPGNVNAGGEGQFHRDELDLAGRDRISGLDQVITDDLMFEGIYGSDWSNDVKDIFSGGNVLLGGGGSDLIAGKGGNDIIDGDRWLNVRISIKSPTDANVELATVDSLQHEFGAGSPAAWVGKTLFQLMIDRVIVPSQLQIVREVLDGSEQGDVDTAMFWDQIQNYTLTRANNGTITVTHNIIGAVAPVLPNTTFLRVSDGVDTVRNIEVFRFGDGAGGFIDYTLGQLFPFAATGAPVISDTTPTEGNVLTADTSSIADLNGLGPFAFQWQSSTNGTTWININNATTSTFSVPDAAGTALGALADQFIRVQVVFTDGRGDSEVLFSNSTTRVGANYDASGVAGAGVTFNGTRGDNVIVGSNFADTLRGNDGNDIINGGNGNDDLFGDQGDDVITGDNGNDTLAGGAGNDTAVFAGPVTNYALSAGGTTFTVADVSGGTGLDTVFNFETLRIGGADYAVQFGTANADTVNGGVGSQVIFGLQAADTLNGGDDSDLLIGGGGNDTVNGGNGDDFIFQGSTDGRDLIDGGAGTDTYILTGSAGAETFRIYTRAEALLAGINNIAGNTEIVITRNGTNNASIIAQLDNIEEIKINTLVTTNNNGNGNVDGGGTAGDTVQVIGDFTQTSLDYSTIRVEGGNGNDTVDISGLTSAHRIVFDANGGTDSFIGGVRPQDVVTGIPGISAGTLSVGGIASDFELMELVQDTSSSFAQSLLEELTLRSGLETASLSMFGAHSPFDHVTGLIDRTDTVDVGVRQLVTDYSLV